MASLTVGPTREWLRACHRVCHWELVGRTNEDTCTSPRASTLLASSDLAVSPVKPGPAHLNCEHGVR